MKPVILVSACLLGVHCRYDGDCQHIASFEKLLPELLYKFQVVPICPEQLGGLPTPRVPAEIYNNVVITSDGKNVNAAFERGAQEAYIIAQMYHVQAAVLKAKSPSCGHEQIYDGTFSKTLIAGDGKTAELFCKNGISVYTEQTVERLLAQYK